MRAVITSVDAFDPIKVRSGRPSRCLRTSVVLYVSRACCLGRRNVTAAVRLGLITCLWMDCVVLPQREHELKRRERQAAQEEALAEALAQRNTAEEARMREIQQICESDPMLRELQEKIKVRATHDHAPLCVYVVWWWWCMQH